MKNFVLYAVLACLFFGSGVKIVHAFAGDAVRFNGFGSLALATSDSASMGFKKTHHSSSPVYKGGVNFRHDSSLGIQGNFTLTPAVKGVVQLLAKDRLNNSVDNVLHYAFIEYSPSYAFSIRGGRLPLDIFLLSDYREVGFAYLWVRPTGLYSTLFYDYFDGAEIAYRHMFGEGVAELKGYVGTLDSVIPINGAEDIQLSLKPIWGVKLQYTTGPWRFISSFQRGRVDTISEYTGFSQVFALLPASLKKELDLSGSNLDYISGGVAYEEGPWRIQGEISKLMVERDFGLDYNSGYLSIGYNIDKWTPYCVFAREYYSQDHFQLSPSETERSPQARQILPMVLNVSRHNSHVNQSTVSLGVRWDIFQSIALKFQWDHHWISDGYSTFWELKNPVVNGDDEVNLYTLSLSFVF